MRSGAAGGPGAFFFVDGKIGLPHADSEVLQARSQKIIF